jgi:hypothetical protein
MTHLGISFIAAALGLALLATPTGGAANDPTAIRPFHAHFSDEELADLKHRIAATRWPDKETVSDQSQGVPLATMQKLARYWATDYDWRTCEAALNARKRPLRSRRAPWA